mmetsp:Transcript_18206/g.61394  ORF Transcript_18206/g.61394 Transcript_18206/m.61394 type:complete len:200 (-) Transcript_18206:634-1233(-)
MRSPWTSRRCSRPWWATSRRRWRRRAATLAESRNSWPRRGASGRARSTLCNSTESSPTFWATNRALERRAPRWHSWWTMRIKKRRWLRWLKSPSRQSPQTISTFSRRRKTRLKSRRIGPCRRAASRSARSKRCPRRRTTRKTVHPSSTTTCHQGREPTLARIRPSPTPLRGTHFPGASTSTSARFCCRGRTASGRTVQR